METINLTVPFFSQRDNNYIWHYKREKDEEIKKKTLKKGSPVTDSAGNEITSKIWDGCCNITCLAMILHYWGLTKETPNQMIEKVFSKTEAGWKWLYEETVEVEGKTRTGAASLENWCF